MEKDKVSAVTSWPLPKTVRELQCFLGFANFYRHFIKGFSSVTAHLTNLLKGAPKRITVTDATRQAFERLKELFSSAPVLKTPDPKKNVLRGGRCI